MLELGRSGSAGTGKGVTPVLRDGVLVATVRASKWKEAATAVVADREWVFGKSKGELRGRWAAEPEEVVRLRASRTSLWKGSWAVDLEGRVLTAESASLWKTAHRFSYEGRQVASSGTTGGWSPHPTLQADDSLPLHQQVFLLWMALVLHRRNNAAVGAATGAAVIGGTG